MALDEEVVEVEESVVVADKQHTPQPGSSPPLSASDAASGLISAGRAVATWAGGNGWSSSTEEADECTLSSAQVAAVRSEPHRVATTRTQAWARCCRTAVAPDHDECCSSESAFAHQERGKAMSHIAEA
jgi:hypothetical protein